MNSECKKSRLNQRSLSPTEQDAVDFFKRGGPEEKSSFPLSAIEAMVAFPDGMRLEIAGEKLTVGKAVYLGRGGTVTETPPSCKGDVVHRIGYAMGPNEIFIQHSVMGTIG